MKLLITGAAGFIGRNVVTEAVNHGHKVIAIVRKLNSIKTNEFGTSVRYVEHDLALSDEMNLNGENIDCAIHLAASIKGDEDEQYQNTVVATSNLLNALNKSDISKLVAVSSIAFYAYNSIKEGSIITENSPVENDTSQSSIYARMKLKQEKLCKAFGETLNNNVIIFRPGIVYSKKVLNDFPIGIIKKGHCLHISHDGEIPLIHVNNLAEALISAAETNVENGMILNVVDNNLPAQNEYLQILRDFEKLPMFCRTVKWKSIINFLSFTNRVVKFLRLTVIQKRLPEVFRPEVFSARFKPFRYSNTRVKDILGWTPKIKLTDLISSHNVSK